MKKLECSSIPLASSLHEFKSPALAEAYQDSGYIDEIAGLKDQMISGGISLHAHRLAHRLAPNKSGYYYLSKLSRDERKVFVKNTNQKNINLIPLTAVLRSDYADMEEFIAFPFVWSDTPEGYEYWSRISTAARWAFNIQNNKKAMGLASIAQTTFEEAAMWAVKAVSS